MGSRRQERGVTAAIDTSSGGKISWNTARALVSEDAAAVLVGGLVRVVDTYSGLVREQFDDFAPMQYAIRDVMRVLLNPEHWAQLGERLATAGVVDNTNIVEGNCIGAGGGMHGRGDRRCDSVSAVEPLSSMLRNHQGAKSAMAELNKLEAVRGAGAALPMPHLIAVYCGLLAEQGGMEQTVIAMTLLILSSVGFPHVVLLAWHFSHPFSMTRLRSSSGTNFYWPIVLCFSRLARMH
ncbi:hypothetical protein ERJ75_001226700 [Trypanosoma vivax]|nr:hypothetical protein ERJ75_001226700 [Trypanosoma vivax]